jgi:hypothetical protein
MKLYNIYISLCESSETSFKFPVSSNYHQDNFNLYTHIHYISVSWTTLVSDILLSAERINDKY